MAGTYDRYRNVDYALPETYLSWDLFGAGLENLGKDGKPIELPLRAPQPDELLLRVDALGLCFSDTKLVWAGPNHPRITGRDLKNDPTVAGHEAALTVVRVGSDWKSTFDIGQRFIIQADIKINGEQKAFGYVQRGAMAQYAYAGPWVLNGDDGCYLLPIKDSTGYAEAALVEPWACVEGAYHIGERTGPADKSRVLVVLTDNAPQIDFGKLFTDSPDKVLVLGEKMGQLGGLVAYEHRGAADAAMVAKLAEEVGGFTDIFLMGTPAPELTEACDNALAKSGMLCFLSSAEIQGRAKIDIGRAHYELTRYIGSSGGSAKAAYGQNVRTDLKAGGRAWMVGAAGPMGQMHVQRALELENPPAVLFCTDLSEERMQYMLSRLQPLADRRGIKLVCVNVGQEKDLDGRIGEVTGGIGFDDVYVHAPVAALAEQASGYLALNSVFNIFAGVGIGTKASLPPEIFRKLHSRLIGSSGSSMEDIKGTLAKMEAGQLATRMSLAALGGIEATWLGLKGVKENRFPGKTVIFPQISGMDLIGLDGFDGVCPEAASRLEPGHVWTNEAERIFMDNMITI